jgi:hypothetical protein
VLSLPEKDQGAKADRRGAGALAPASRDGYIGLYLQHVVVRTYVLVGEPG